MGLSRRQLVRSVGGACLAGVAAGLAGCSDGQQGVEITTVEATEVDVGHQVRMNFSNGAEEDLEAIAHAKVFFGEANDRETHTASQRATLTAMRNTVVEMLIAETESADGTDTPLDAEAWAEFPDADRTPMDTVDCTSCDG